MSRYKEGNIPVYLLTEAMYVCADYELTGTNKAFDVIIEYAHLFGDSNGRIMGEYESLVNPGRDTGPVDVHHITNEMVVGAPSFNEIADTLAQMLNGKILVSNNNALDIKALTRQFNSSGMLFNPGRPIDITHFAADSTFIDEYFHEIEDIVSRQTVFHRAMPDARMVAELLPHIVEYIRDHPERVSSFEPCCVLARNIEPLTRV